MNQSTTEQTSSSPTPAELLPLAGVPDDGRRFARRDCKLRAHMTIGDSLDETFAAVREFDVIVRNISRSGVCFVFFRQLYPDDRVTLDFGDLVRQYRIARCRRLQADCYEIGAAIVSG